MRYVIEIEPGSIRTRFEGIDDTPDVEKLQSCLLNAVQASHIPYRVLANLYESSSGLTPQANQVKSDIIRLLLQADEQAEKLAKDTLLGVALKLGEIDNLAKQSETVSTVVSSVAELKHP